MRMHIYYLRMHKYCRCKDVESNRLACNTTSFRLSALCNGRRCCDLALPVASCVPNDNREFGKQQYWVIINYRCGKFAESAANRLQIRPYRLKVKPVLQSQQTAPVIIIDRTVIANVQLPHPPSLCGRLRRWCYDAGWACLTVPHLIA